MLAPALEAEVDACIAELADERDERGRRLVVRDSHRRPRKVTTAAGTVEVTKGAGSRAAALAMVFTLVESAQARWRAVNAPHLVALIRAGARFGRGQLGERPEALGA